MKVNFITKTAIALCALTIFGTVMAGRAVYAAEQNHKNDTLLHEQLDNRFSERTYQVPVEQKGIKKFIPAGWAYIPKGVKLTVELRDRITSERLSKYGDGQAVPFVLRDNLIVNDVIVAPAGTEVKGHVAYCDERSMLKHGGSIAIQIDSFRTINNVEVPLNFQIEREQRTDEQAWESFLLPVLFAKGKNVAFQAGTPFEVTVAEDVDLGTDAKHLARTIEAAVAYTVE